MFSAPRITQMSAAPPEDTFVMSIR